MEPILEEQIHNVILVVRHKWLRFEPVLIEAIGFGVGGGGSELEIEAGHALEEAPETTEGERPAKRNNLHGDGEAARAEAGHQLGLVDDDDKAAAGTFHHLLTEQGPAAALHEVEGRVYLVGPVDGEVHHGVGVEVGEGDAGGRGAGGCPLGGRDADDVPEGTAA